MHVTAKPSSFQCNLKCDYCFYLEKSRSLLMKMDGWQHSERVHQTIYRSVWQSGLFYLARRWTHSGWPGFFRKVIHYQQRYAGQKRILMHYKRMAFYWIMNGVPFSKNMSFWLVSRSMDPRSYMIVTDAVIQVTVLLQSDSSHRASEIISSRV